MNTGERQHAHLESRIGVVEGAIEHLRDDVSSIKGDLRSIASSVNSGFDQMRREQNAGSQVNWGWIAAFIGVGVAITGGITSALISPLSKFDEHTRAHLVETSQDFRSVSEQSIRHDERLKVLERQQNQRCDSCP